MPGMDAYANQATGLAVMKRGADAGVRNLRQSLYQKMQELRQKQMDTAIREDKRNRQNMILSTLASTAGYMPWKDWLGGAVQRPPGVFNQPLMGLDIHQRPPIDPYQGLGRPGLA